MMAEERRPDGPTVDDIIAAASAEIAALRNDGATPADPKTKLAENTYTVEELDALPDPPWLVADVLPANGLGIIWGESGAYKTFLALDLACRVAAGLHAWERRTEQTSVLYIAGEGAHGIRKRIRAWRTVHPDADLSALFVCTYAPPLAAEDQMWAQGLADLASEMVCGLTIVDTVARSFGGGDENATRDMGLFVMGCDRVARATNGAVVGVHHAGHDKSRMRGNTSLYAACGVVLGVARTADNWCQMSNSWASKGKAKDAEEMDAPLTFRLEKHGDSLVPVQADPSEMPSGGDVEARAPKALSTDKLARINTVVTIARALGGTIASTNTLMKEAGWRSYDKAEKALLDAAEAGAMECIQGPNRAKTWSLCEGWDR